MLRAKVRAAPLLLAGAIVTATPATGQVTIGADVGLNSRYMFWGLTLSNRPVVQPDVYLSYAGFTGGVWANIELAKDDDENDFTSGGIRRGITEVDYWLEYNREVGPTELKLGVVRWTYDQDNTGTLSPYATQDNFPGLGNGPDINSTEVYGAITLTNVLLSPNLTLYYDTDIYKGLFGWGAVSHAVPIGTQSLELGALMGFSTGHANTAGSQIPLYTESGITHFDFSAAVPLTAGVFSITPNAHFQVNGDNATKFTSGTETDGNFVFTFGTTLSWSRDFGGGEEEPEIDVPAKDTPPE